MSFGILSGFSIEDSVFGSELYCDICEKKIYPSTNSLYSFALAADIHRGACRMAYGAPKPKPKPKPKGEIDARR